MYYREKDTDKLQLTGSGRSKQHVLKYIYLQSVSIFLPYDLVSKLTVPPVYLCHFDTILAFVVNPSCMFYI